jgi:hypothetical protein
MATTSPAVLSDQTTRPSEKAKLNISWPIRAASLRALSELGLSDVRIAAYLKVGTEQVRSLRIRYRIAEGHWKA